MYRLRGRVGVEVASAGVLIAGTLAAAFWGWFVRADQQLFDLFMKAWHRPAPTDIVIVAVDEESIARIGRWPWRRAVHATLIEQLTKDRAAAVGLDLLLGEAEVEDPSSDDALRTAIAANGRVVLPVLALDEGDATATWRPLSLFAGAAAGLGRATVRADSDGIARTVTLRQPDDGGVEHFAIAVLRRAGAQMSTTLPSRYYIPYAGSAGHFHTVAYSDVLDGSLRPGFFRDKIVLVGATAVGLRAGHVAPADALDRRMSGVEIHANVIDGLRRGIVVTAVPEWLAALASASLLLLLCLAVARLPSRSGLLTGLGGAVTAIICSAGALRFAQIWIGPSAAVVGAALVFPVWTWHRLAAAHRFLESELDRLKAEGIDVSAAPSALGSVAGGVIGRAIASLNEATAAKRRAWATLEQALAQLTTGVVVADASGNVRLANQRAKDSILPTVTLPVRIERWIAELDADALLGRDADDLPARIERTNKRGRNLVIDLARLPDTGTGGGQVLAIADVTDLREAERRREQSMRFISHDLRSPIASLISIAQILQDPDEPADPAFSLARIELLGRKALNLADDFLRLARAKSLNRAAFRPVDLGTVARRAAEEVDPVARVAHVAVRIESEGDPHQHAIRGDADLLERTFINLIGNAVRHSPQGTEVTIRLWRDGTTQWIEVADRGSGIAADVLPRLFSPYVRSARATHEGTGLGLVIVKTVVERHGGQVEVESAPQAGARFRLRFPART